MENRYVYIVSFESDVLRRLNPYAKIGMAVDVEKRLRGIQTGSPLKLKTFGCFESNAPQTAEALIHKLLKSDNVSGEWFSISEKMVHVLRSRFEIKDDLLHELIVRCEDTPDQVRIRELENYIITQNHKIDCLTTQLEALKERTASPNKISRRGSKKSLEEFKHCCVYKPEPIA